MLANIGDDKQYIDNLFRLLTNGALRKRLGINAISTAKKYFDSKTGTKIYIKELKDKKY